MSHVVDYTLELTVSGPLISQAAGTLALGADTAMQRYRGVPVLNGSLIRGNIRHVLGEFAGLCGDDLKSRLPAWFGHGSDTEGYQTQRATVHFDFFWQLTNAEAFQTDPTGDPVSPSQRTRIRIEDESGKVANGALQVIEDCFPAGLKNPVFSGHITGLFRTRQDARVFEYWLAKALDYIPALGSFKGSGFGKLQSWQLTLTPLKKQRAGKKQPTLPSGSTRFGIILTLDRPFCVGRPVTEDSNRIVSKDFLAGNLIKGVIARQFYYDDSNNRIDTDRLLTTLCFDELIISHALPTLHQKRPKPVPLSLAWVGDELRDMAGLASAPDSIRWQQAPAFQPDWKSAQWQNAHTLLGNGEQSPDRYLSVRTEINTQGVAREHRLFTLECIDPEGFQWCADIELKNIPEQQRPAVFSKLIQLFNQGLVGIGKTKAHARITYLQNYAAFKPMPPALPAWQNSHFIVTLTTAARLLPQQFTLGNVNTHPALKQLYQNYWRQLDPGITLLRYFAKQALTSAYYHQRQRQRQRQHQHASVAYQPEWLTTAGSVFVLEVNDLEAQERLQACLHTGLPAHPGSRGTQPGWQDTPFLPEHGYGEIEINRPEQLQRLYTGGESA